MDKRVEAIIEIMRSRTRRCLSVSKMAQVVGLSHCHFTHLFKLETSKTPVGYLKEVRMQKAEELLAKTSLSLKEVVYAVGLNDRSHFSREFKRRNGLTPRQFITQRRPYNIDKSSMSHSATTNPATE